MWLYNRCAHGLTSFKSDHLQWGRLSAVSLPWQNTEDVVASVEIPTQRIGVTDISRHLIRFDIGRELHSWKASLRQYVKSFIGSIL